jgi:hypothetical protein
MTDRILRSKEFRGAVRMGRRFIWTNVEAVRMVQHGIDTA